MLMRTNSLRDLDRLPPQPVGTVSQPAGMPLVAYRDGEVFVLCLDLPGIDPQTVDLNVERNVLTVRAERASGLPQGAQVLADERVLGRFSRQVLLSDALDTDRIEADYDQGVLSVRVPIGEKARPRKITITAKAEREAISA
ncbi:Hsp20/alpha crystallin family protein [Kitasatospora sp. NPDC058243]|uniref:Hsp20/alpha crystallin family protein n=1 Tax=unclassified Kitasatospora TaxID=2633591 RepID=UPI00352DC59A|nr:Hsp20/alpha crystallin family protein [Kitasatospora sp. NBC_01300]